MARPTKIGLDYFPLDCNIDDNLELVEAEWGLAGFSIIVKLWQKIYSNGYYIEWNDDSVLLFSRKINTELTLINSVINSCFRRNIFDEKLYKKYKILTSSGIQKRYLIACQNSKRKAIPFIIEFKLVNSEFTNIITELIHVNSEFSTQSKEEESKEEESKEGIEADKSATPTLENRKLDFQNKLKLFLNIYDRSILNAFYNYWTESNEGGKKMRFEMQKVFNIKARLKTWSNNEKKFKKTNNREQKQEAVNQLQRDAEAILNHLNIQL